MIIQVEKGKESWRGATAVSLKNKQRGERNTETQNLQ
jgi:hypothetical protein